MSRPLSDGLAGFGVPLRQSMFTNFRAPRRSNTNSSNYVSLKCAKESEGIAETYHGHRLSLLARNTVAYQDPPGWQIDWSLMTPTLMREYSEEFLNYVSEKNGGGNYDTWARAEIARRQSVQLGELIASLTTATHEVHREVVLLNTSSERMERHTITLKQFTVVLIIFAAIQIVIAGVQTWKMFQPEAQHEKVLVVGHPEPWH